jgi:hypothetical protein
MVTILFGTRGFWGYITPTSFLVQISVVSHKVGQNVWNSSSSDGLDMILNGRGVLVRVNWTGLAGFLKTTPQVLLAFSTRHAQFEPVI